MNKQSSNKVGKMGRLQSFAKFKHFNDSFGVMFKLQEWILTLHQFNLRESCHYHYILNNVNMITQLEMKLPVSIHT